jgi:hypothetical protein
MAMNRTIEERSRTPDGEMKEFSYTCTTKTSAIKETPPSTSII